MQRLLAFTRLVDALNDRFGGLASFMVLAAILISAGNATVRYLFSFSSNGLLEVQWYLFGGVVFLGAAQTLRLNGHIRVDVLYSLASTRLRLLVDLFGLVAFLLPATAFLAWLAWPVFVTSFTQSETSANYGGLIRWPIMLVIPLGFALLWLQGVAELIKRVAALTGQIAFDTSYEKPSQ